MKWLINTLLSKANFDLFSSDKPIGRCLGKHDIPDVPNTYAVLTVSLGQILVFTGYFQKS